MLALPKKLLTIPSIYAIIKIQIKISRQYLSRKIKDRTELSQGILCAFLSFI